MNREQFTSYVESTQETFRRFLVALCCGNSALADDIAQEAYLKAYLSCEQIEDNAKFRAWLFRIGYNAFLDHKSSTRIFEDVEQARAAESAAKADSQFEYQELYLALNSLPPKERTAILLFYMEDYSIKEIAGIVEASQGAVKQYLSRGRAHLRSLISHS